MNLTVAICTWNRCQLLRKTLQQMTKLEVPDGIEWELLIVDNNSSDATAQVIAEFRDRLPLRSVFEAVPGTSHARNRAVREAAGEYIVWTDDDVLVGEDWLAAYVAAFRRWPTAAVFGGPIEPWFEGSPPAWLARAFGTVAGAYAALDLGPRPIPLTYDRYPYNANLAARTEVHRRVPYDTQLGPRPGDTMRGEEMVLVRELLAAGEQGWWVPEARVRHFIPRERQTLRYLRGYYYGGGKVLALLENGVNASSSTFLGRPVWLWRQAVTYEALFQLRRFVARPEVWVEDLKWASTSWGQLRGGRHA